MDNRAEVREFLMTRRARVTPDAVGLTVGSNRRVAGLRRSEVAALAGVSVEYYSKLERNSAPVKVGTVPADWRLPGWQPDWYDGSEFRR